MCGACSTNEIDDNEHKISVGKAEVKREIGRPRRRWEDSIMMNLQENVCVGGLD